MALCAFNWIQPHNQIALSAFNWLQSHNQIMLCAFKRIQSHNQIALCAFNWIQLHNQIAVCAFSSLLVEDKGIHPNYKYIDHVTKASLLAILLKKKMRALHAATCARTTFQNFLYSCLRCPYALLFDCKNLSSYWLKFPRVKIQNLITWQNFFCDIST